MVCGAESNGIGSAGAMCGGSPVRFGAAARLARQGGGGWLDFARGGC